MAGELIARVFVPGRPRTKGSLKPILIRSGGKVRASLTEDHALSKPWKLAMMRGLVGAYLGGGPMGAYPEAVEVHAFFRFERQEAVDGSGAVPSQAGGWPTAITIGDIDKLYRNVLDALTQAHVLADDSLVVGGMPYKRWCEPGEKAGVLIVVTAAPDIAAVLGTEALIAGYPR